MSVTHVTAGNVTDATATVAAKANSGASIRLVVSTNVGLTSPVYSSVTTRDAYGYFKLDIGGLTARTNYHYGLEVDGVVDAIQGRFKTLPVPSSVADFTIAFGSCWIQGEDHKPPLRIADRDVDLFLQLGDNGYNDVYTTNYNSFASATDETPYHTAWDAMLATANIPTLAQRHAWAYIWDDHDYGVNNSDGGFFCRPAASNAYRRMWPHYPLSAGTGDNPIYQAFNIGRVRFILTDERSRRDTSTMATQTPSSTMLGATQKAWFKQELLDSKARGDGLIVWCSSNIYIADEAWQPSPYTADDSWAEFTYERAELADFMKANGIDTVCMLVGDQHALAMDSGVHADYATGGGVPIPQFNAAPLGRVGGNRKGGPYDYESFVSSSNSHYGLMSVTDEADRIIVTWEGWTVDDTTGAETLKYSHRFTRGARVKRGVVVGGVKKQLLVAGVPVSLRAR